MFTIKRFSLVLLSSLMCTIAHAKIVAQSTITGRGSTTTTIEASGDGTLYCMIIPENKKPPYSPDHISLYFSTSHILVSGMNCNRGLLGWKFPAGTAVKRMSWLYDYRKGVGQALKYKKDGFPIGFLNITMTCGNAKNSCWTGKWTIRCFDGDNGWPIAPGETC